MADYLWLFLGSALIVLGLIGCFLPVLPGPLLSFAGLFVLRFTAFVDPARSDAFDTILWISAGFVVLASVLDYLVPVWGARTFGASRAGIWGAALGLLVGLLFFPPFGILVGPFIGAVLGELLSGKDRHSSLRAGFGSFLGALGGIAVKASVSGTLTWLFLKELFF